ncbi:MAG: RimK/LysX family protein [Succinivibrio sp.]
MLRARTTIAAALFLAAASAHSADSDIGDKLLSVKGTMDSINEEIRAQHADISRLTSDFAASTRESAAMNRQLLNEIKALRRQNQALLDANSALIKAGSSNGSKEAGKQAQELLKAVGTPRDYDIETPDGKMLFGGEEYVYVQEANATLAARVDTGATVSSIAATNISRFESDGVKKVRFTIEFNDRTIDVEAPFVRVTRVRQSSSSGFSYRLVVGLNIKIADYSVYTEFNLMDRSHMDFPMLLGRSLLTDIAAVDVSRSYIQKRADPDGLLLINRDLYTMLKKNGENVNKDYDARMSLVQGGQPAEPDDSYGSNLGTDSTKALPEVTQKSLEQEYMQKFKDAGVSLPPDAAASSEGTLSGEEAAKDQDGGAQGAQDENGKDK